MATTAQSAQPAHAAPTHTRSLTRPHPIALWHLLSLDAPTVAALWTWFLAAANHIRLPLTATLAMAAAVWTLYAADRLLDARLLDARPLDNRPLEAHPLHHLHSPIADLEPRHLFHHHHRRAFRTGILAASLALTLLLPRLTPAALHLYLILGVLLFAYFILIHLPTANLPSAQSPAPAPPLSRRLPKELAVGVFFSAAIFIPTVARDPSLRALLLPAALLFALLCSLNCLFIYAWEHPQADAPHPAANPPSLQTTNPGAPSFAPLSHAKGRVSFAEANDRSLPRAPHPTPHPATHLALRFLHPLAASIVLASALLAAASLTHPQTFAPWPIPAATALAALLLLLLDQLRGDPLHGDHDRPRLTPTTLRAAADLCLLTPILFLPFLHA